MANLTPEQLKNYYEQELPDELRLMLSTLDALISKSDDAEFLQVLVAWSKYIGNPEDPALIRQYRADLEKLNLSSSEVWRTELPNEQTITVEQAIAIALLGLQRIKHVGINSRKHIAVPQGESLIAESEQLFATLNGEAVLEVSINGGPVSWRFEKDQDSAKTYQKIGKPDLAAEKFTEAINYLQSKSINQGITTAESSALAVLFYRLGDLKKDLFERMLGLNRERRNSEKIFNRDRLLTLAFGTFKSALSPKYPADFGLRVESVQAAGEAWASSFTRQPLATLKTSAKEIFKLLKK